MSQGILKLSKENNEEQSGNKLGQNALMVKINARFCYRSENNTWKWIFSDEVWIHIKIQDIKKVSPIINHKSSPVVCKQNPTLLL